MMVSEAVYPNCQDFKSCFNCDHSYTMCGELICRWYEAYVSATGKCPWWVKKVEEKEKT